jgi:hypothetical protein
MPNPLRTQKNDKKYKKYFKYLKDKKKGCPLCERKTLKSFKYWKIMKNDFPYDKIAKKHQMIVPRRHVVENKLNLKELAELKKIKNNFIHKARYDYIIEATNINKSLPNHFHLHLILLK